MRIKLLGLFLLLAPLPVFAQSISIGPNGVRVGEEQHSPEWYRAHGFHRYNDRWYSAEEWEHMGRNVQGNERGEEHSAEWYQRHNYHWANDHWYSEEEWHEYREHHRHHDNDENPN